MSENETKQQTETSSQETTTQTNSSTQDTTSQNPQTQKETTEESSSVISDALNTDDSTSTETKTKPEDIKSETKGDNVDDKEKPKDGDEEYEDIELSLDENSPLTQEELDDIASIASENNWTKEQAESEIKKREQFYSRGLDEGHRPMKEYFEKQTKLFNEDPDFNGDNKKQTYLNIKIAAEKLGSKELLAELNTPQIGNNYHLAKFMSNIGRQLQGDVPLGKGSGGEAPAKDSRTEQLKLHYPEMFKE